MARALYPRGEGKGKRERRFLGYYWKGISQLDGQPIVVVFTFRSGNRKTGKMVQTWILRENVNPQLAVKLGLDFTICGDCKQRPSCGGKCYVTVARAPLTVWKAYRRGRYQELELADLHRFFGRILRIGSYGDPLAVDLRLWTSIMAGGQLAGHTGYSHSWRHPLAAGYQSFLMASVDSPAEFLEASSSGWKCFRARHCGEGVLPGERVCPASAEAGHKTQCATCKACNGLRGHRVIFLHGFRARERMVAQ